tara:strand:- start:792 stop:1040 length:249 start_codon:yes stop_codon:yes gene_type:complete
MTIEVKTRPVQLPTFWDRDVIFFVNMLSIFYDNHGELERLKQHVMGVETYGGRLVPIINTKKQYFKILKTSRENNIFHLDFM